MTNGQVSAIMTLDAFELYEQSLGRDPGPVGLIAGWFRTCTLAVEGVGYEREDIVAALLGVASRLLANAPGTDPAAVGQQVGETVTESVAFFLACPDEQAEIH